jgi:hypothetical protein
MTKEEAIVKVKEIIEKEVNNTDYKTDEHGDELLCLIETDIPNLITQLNAVINSITP